MPHKIRMKTIFAFSDIHEGTLPPRLLAVAEESDYVFFLGDGAARMGDLALHKGFFAVSLFTNNYFWGRYAERLRSY